jgi:hypothetical protein
MDEPRQPPPTTSLLVRCWLEPREDPRGEPVFRATVRDLRTGEERHLSDPKQLGELALRALKAERSKAREDGEGERQERPTGG